MMNAAGGLIVICDLDGTLCDTNTVDDECYRAALSKLLNLEPSDWDWTDSPHITDTGIARWLWTRHQGRHPSAAEIERMQSDFVALLEEEARQRPARFRPIDGAGDFISRCRDQGIAIGIGTGGWRRSAELKLAAASLPRELLLATSDDAEARIDIFGLARARLKPESIAPGVLIGDGVWDFVTAQALGWSFIGVGAGDRARRLRDAGARHVIPDFTHLSDLQVPM